MINQVLFKQICVFFHFFVFLDTYIHMCRFILTWTDMCRFWDNDYVSFFTFLHKLTNDHSLETMTRYKDVTQDKFSSSIVLQIHSVKFIVGFALFEAKVWSEGVRILDRNWHPLWIYYQGSKFWWVT